MSTHYTPPQSVHPLGLVYGGLAALVGSLLLAPIYSYAIVYIPFVYINLLLTGLFGVGVGMSIAAAFRMGQMHNTALSYGGVAFGALFAYWLHWIWWFSGLAFRSDMTEFSAFDMLFPPTLIEAIAYANEVGTWGMRSSDSVSGIVLTIIWVLEAVIFFGAALFSASLLIGSGVFCARCNRWCNELPARRLQADPTGELARRLNDAQDVSVLMRPAPSAGVGVWHEAVIHTCEECGTTNTVTVKDVSVTHDKKGNENRKEDITVDRVYIAADDLKNLLSA